MADPRTIFLRDVQAYRESLALGMAFLSGAVIDDRDDPDDHSIRHMYHVELGGWNRPYMELAGQVVREAMLPYADLSGEGRWADLARTIIVEGVLAHAACREPKSPAYGLLCNCADRPCDYGSPLTGEQMVEYRLAREAFVAKHPNCRRGGRFWGTMDSVEVLIAAILLNGRRREAVLEEFIERSWRCFLNLIDADGNVPEYYDDLEEKWGRPEAIAGSRLLWACALMRQAGMPPPETNVADRLADALLAQQRPNGIIASADAQHIVAEFVIYCIEGLYWGGVLLDRPEWVAAAQRSFDALLAAPHVMAGAPYFVYDRNWRPVPPFVAGGPAGVTQEINHMSVVGQVANLSLQFWRRTGDRRYLDTFRYAIDLLFCFQDRRSTGPARGGVPRSANMTWWRSICPVYTYASALIAGVKHLES